jgi:hypothetical protein
MRRVGLRIALSSGGWSLAGAALVAATIAAGLAAILTLLSVAPAVEHRTDRAAWNQMVTGYGPPAEDGLLVATHQTYLADRAVAVVSVGRATPASPRPPGVDRLPERGEALVSPALARALAAHPEAAGRYGTVVGTIGAAGLVGPDDFVVLNGMPDNLVEVDGTRVETFPGHADLVSFTGPERLVFVLGAVSLAVLVTVLVGAATRMTARRRSERMAVLGLLGATPAQRARIAEGEMVPTALVGVVGGVGLFFAARPGVAGYRYDGDRFFPADLWPGATTVGVVVLGTFLLAVLAARLGAGATRDPLATARRAAVDRPRPARWVLLAGAVGAAVAALTIPAAPSRPLVVAVFATLLLAVVGVGREVARVCGTVLGRVPRGAALLAGRRLAAHPSDGFRPVSAVALAVMITTTFVALVPVAASSVERDGVVAQRVGTARADIPFASVAESTRMTRDLAALPGVGAVAPVRTGTVSGTDGRTVWIGDCRAMRAATGIDIACGDGNHAWATARTRAELASVRRAEVYSLASRTVRPAGAGADDPTSVRFALGTVGVMAGRGGIDLPDLVVDASAVPGVGKFRPEALAFTFDSAATLERARTVVERGQEGASVADRTTTADGFGADVNRLFDTVVAGSLGLAVLASLALVLTLAATVHERRDHDATLRVSGVRPATIGRAAFLETAVPLTVTTLLAASLGIGFGAAVVAATDDGPYPLAAAVRPVAAILGVALVVVGLAAAGAARNGRNRVPRSE